MPLLRYFLFVGGALLALLLITSAVLPRPPVNDTTLASAVDLPVIRIHSDRKPPQPIVYDTNAPIFRQTMVAKADVAAPAPAPALARVASKAEKSATDKASTKPHVREAFAQLPQDQAASQPKLNEMAQTTLPEPKVYPVKRQPAKRKQVARYRSAHPMMMVAQQPHFGFNLFGNTW